MMNRFAVSLRALKTRPLPYLLLALVALSGAGRAATITVTSTADNTTVDGQVTLREAINAANTDASVDGSMAGSGGDTIVFDATVFASAQTIQLTTVLPNLSSNITITGPGANLLTVNGEAQSNNNYRIFNVTTGNTVSISGLTISNGKAAGANGATGAVGQGGAILNVGSLTLTACAFSSNFAQGGSGTGSLASGGLGQGGAIYSTGPQLTVQRCTFSSNYASGGSGGNGAYINNTQTSGFQPGGPGAAAQGAAIYADAPSGVTITNSTFYGNAASGGSGGGSGFSNSPSNSGTGGAGGNGAGGAIYSAQALTLTSNTIAGNTASGGIGGYNNAFSNVGAGGNASGGGILSVGTVTIGNTLVAINNANSGSSDVTPGTAAGPDVFGAFSSNNFNLISVLTASATGFTGADQTGTTGSPLDAKLDPQGAQDNGGPTKTVRLKKGSPAVDKGKDIGPLGVDQRGNLRPKELADATYPNATGGDGSDIGAFEAQSLPNDVPTVNSPQTVNGQEGVALSNQQVTGNDGDNDTLTFSLVTGTMPDGLTLNSDGTVTGTPAGAGQTSVTFKANDGLDDSNTATLNINITEASSLVVDTDIDNSTNSDGLTSLREAVTFAANDGQPTPVTFDPTFFATAKTITLNQSNGPLTITSAVDINGPAAGVTISGGDSMKIMQVYGFGVGIAVNLRDLTFANGHVGAFTSGSALSLFNFGGTPNVTLTGCTLKNNGGDDTKGGAIENNGATLTLVNCTLSGNHADDSGQNFNFAVGGALYQGSGSTTLTNCTLSGNHSNGTGARGGAIANDGGTVTLNNTIVAGNAATTGPNIAGAVVGTSSYNLIGDGTGMTGITDGTSGNQIGTSASPIAPLLGALAPNGGPTETMALQTSSPAIDKGFKFGATTDQRGLTRPVGTALVAGGDGSDIGAYEVQAPPVETPSLIVTTNIDNSTNTDNLTSLREAIAYANSNADASAITFDPTFFATAKTITLTGGELLITTATTITGPAVGVTVDGVTDSFDILKVNTGVTFTASGLTISNGLTDLTNYGTATVTNCTLSGNTYGIGNYGTATVTNCTLSGNTTTGLYNEGTVTVTNCTLSGNSYGLERYGTATLTFCTLSGNTYGLYSEGTATVTNCTISGNNKGVDNSGGTATLNNTICAGNTADVIGALEAASSYNLIGDGTDLTGITNGTSGNQIGTNAAPIDPLLGTLANNGGPTKTIALLPGSLALGKANPANALATDQRGFPRPQPSGGKPDIGAFETEVLSVSNPTVTETVGGVNADFVVSLGSPALRAITFDAATQDYSALAGKDYTGLATTSYTINVGETSKTISVPVLDDSANELQEAFRLLLSNSNQAGIRANSGILGGRAIINDNDPAPTVSTADLPTINEGNSGIQSLHFSVQLSAASSRTVVVTYSFGGTATYGSDYTAPGGSGGTLTFTPGQTNKAVAFVVQRDTVPEADETIRLQLLSATSGTLGSKTGTQVLTNDDALPKLSINDVTLAEGSSGTTNFTFTVSLSKVSGQAVTVSYQTGNGSAVKPGDYSGKAGTLTFAPNETSKTVTVAVVGDAVHENDETFTVDLSNAAGATILDGQGQGTILDDDASG